MVTDVLLGRKSPFWGTLQQAAQLRKKLSASRSRLAAAAPGGWDPAARGGEIGGEISARGLSERKNQNPATAPGPAEATGF